MAKKDEKRMAKEKKQAERAQRRRQQRKAQAVLSKNQIADQLRALAAQFEAGRFVLGDKELELPPYADFEIAYKVKRRGGHQIEVEVEWGDPMDVPLLPTE